MTYALSQPPETNKGITISWLPLTSTWSTVSECATAGIYSQLNGNPGLAIADDPFYGLNLNNSLTCLPPQVTLWWAQSTATPLLKHTSLGPIVCPEHYTTATTSIINGISTFVGCCPSDYGFGVTKDSGTLGQCNSPLSLGQVLTYVHLSPRPHTTTATITNEGASVYAIQVNGYNFAPSPKTGVSSILSSSKAPLSPAITTTPTVLPPSPQNSSGGLNTAVKAGIGVGVSLGFVGVCALLLTFIYIRRHARKAGVSESTSTTHGLEQPPSEETSNDIDVAEVVGNDREQSIPIYRHELAGTSK